MRENMENKKPKIALCLSGKPTSSYLCFPYIYDAFLNNDYDVDVFIHTWDNYRIIDLYNPKKIQIDSQTPDLVYNLKHQLQLPNPLKIEGNIDKNMLQFYSINRSINLVPDDYDIIIRSRFDLIFQNKFNISPIIDDITSDKYDIYIPDEVFNMGGYQDRIAIGNYKSMKIYSELYINLNIIVNKLNRWHPESFLGEQLDSNNIRVFQNDIEHRIVRKSSIVTNWPENPFNFKDI